MEQSKTEVPATTGDVMKRLVGTRGSSAFGPFLILVLVGNIAVSSVATALEFTPTEAQWGGWPESCRARYVVSAAGKYFCEAQNDVGTVRSDVAVLTVAGGLHPFPLFDQLINALPPPPLSHPLNLLSSNSLSPPFQSSKTSFAKNPRMCVPLKVIRSG